MEHEEGHSVQEMEHEEGHSVQEMEHEEGYSVQEMEHEEGYSVQEMELLQIHVVGHAAVWEEDYYNYTQCSDCNAHQYR